MGFATPILTCPNNAIKDEQLAAERSKAESDPADSGSSRNRIIKVIEAKYTAAE